MIRVINKNILNFFKICRCTILSNEVILSLLIPTFIWDILSNKLKFEAGKKLEIVKEFYANTRTEIYFYLLVSFSLLFLIYFKELLFNVVVNKYREKFLKFGIKNYMKGGFNDYFSGKIHYSIMRRNES